MYHPSRNARKKVLCWFTRALSSSPFRRKKEKTLFPLAFRSLWQTSLSSPSGCFNIPSSYARENTKPALPKKKTRANAVSTHGKRVLSREIALARAAFRSRFPLLLSKTKSNTRQLRIIVKSRYTSWLFVSPWKKKMKTRNQNRRSKSTLKNQRATRKSAQKTYLSACSASFALNTRSSRSILTLYDAFVCIFR